MKAKKTSVRLADGRELIYYDEHPSADRQIQDTRDLGEATIRSEIRYDPLLGEWVVLASHRQDRTHLPPAELCPLCPSTTTHKTEIPAADYDVVVFENRFPSLVTSADTVDEGDELVPRRPGIGRCEVVCFTSDHGGSLAGLPTSRLRTVIDVWADRTTELGAIPGVEHVFPFENRGEEIGDTLHHPPTARSTPTRSSPPAPPRCSTPPGAIAPRSTNACSARSSTRSRRRKCG
jgi:UDPglucose--hexose-1-phosphate uridylyltransferase